MLREILILSCFVLISKGADESLRVQCDNLEKIEEILTKQSEDIDSLKEIVKMQRQVILAKQSEEMDSLKKIVKNQQEEIADLSKRLSAVEDDGVIIDEEKNKDSHVLNLENADHKTNKYMHQINASINRETRLLMSTPSSNQMVAFYAYTSKPETNIGPHHTLVFDTVITNLFHGYSNYSGVFRVPRDGVYVFITGVRTSCNLWATFEMVKNGDVIGLIHVNSANCAGQTTTGTIVIVASKEDIIFIRTRKASTTSGSIVGDVHGWPYFAGWLISG